MLNDQVQASSLPHEAADQKDEKNGQESKYAHEDFEHKEVGVIRVEVCLEFDLQLHCILRVLRSAIELWVVRKPAWVIDNNIQVGVSVLVSQELVASRVIGLHVSLNWFGFLFDEGAWLYLSVLSPHCDCLDVAVVICLILKSYDVKMSLSCIAILVRVRQGVDIEPVWCGRDVKVEIRIWESVSR